MVAADAGLGKIVFNASNFLRTDVVIPGILVIGFRGPSLRNAHVLDRRLGRPKEGKSARGKDRFAPSGKPENWSRHPHQSRRTGKHHC
jgi:hypothetical protein